MDRSNNKMITLFELPG